MDISRHQKLESYIEVTHFTEISTHEKSRPLKSTHLTEISTHEERSLRNITVRHCLTSHATNHAALVWFHLILNRKTINFCARSTIALIKHVLNRIQVNRKWSDWSHLLSERDEHFRNSIINLTTSEHSVQLVSKDWLSYCYESTELPRVGVKVRPSSVAIFRNFVNFNCV